MVFGKSSVGAEVQPGLRTGTLLSSPGGETEPPREGACLPGGTGLQGWQNAGLLHPPDTPQLQRGGSWEGLA